MCSNKRLRASIWFDKEANANCWSTDLFTEYSHILDKALGVHFQVMHSNESAAGKKLLDGSWSGVIGMIQRGEADIGLRPFLITEERKEAVDFTSPYRLDRYTFATKHPESSPEMLSIIHPFATSTWITLSISIVLIHMIYARIFRNKVSPTSLFFRILAALTGQGMNLNPIKLHERLVVISWLIGSLFFTHCYKSVLLSFLTVPKLKGVRDLLELSAAVSEGRYSCVVRKISYAPYLLRNSRIHHERIIGNNIEQNPSGYGGSKVLFENPQANVAFIGLKSDITHLSPKFFISEDYFNPVIMAFAVSKNLPCKEKLNKAVLRIMESGLFDAGSRRNQFCKFLKTVSLPDGSKGSTMLTFADVCGAFILLFGGYFVGIITLTREMLW